MAKHYAPDHDHNAAPDYTPADLGVDKLSTVTVDPLRIHVDARYQGSIDEKKVARYIAEGPDALAARVGLAGKRDDGTYWVVNGAHHTEAAVQEDVPKMTYRCFPSTGSEQEAQVMKAWKKWHRKQGHGDGS